MRGMSITIELPPDVEKRLAALPDLDQRVADFLRGQAELEQWRERRYSAKVRVIVRESLAEAEEAVVGDNAFAHESGIHQHGMLANPLTYEIMTPESVGRDGTHLVLGKHSGRRLLEQRLAELGHPLSRSELDEVYLRFTELADRKKSIYDQDLLGLLKPQRSANMVGA